MVKRICVVVEGYPYKDDPQFSFIEVLCHQLAAKNVTISVISPQSLLHVLLRKFRAHPTKRTYYPSKGGESITVYRPFTIILPHRFQKANEFIYKKTVEFVFRQNRLTPDICYGHFWYNGYYISDIAKRNNIPLFIASGEGNFDDLESLYKTENYQKFSKDVAGVICVSSSCRDISIAYGLTTKDKCIVIPNAIDENMFYLKDKKNLRQKYHVPQDKFIVAFVGALIHRKGSERLSEALTILNDDSILSFFIGKGQGLDNHMPKCKGVFHCGPLAHDLLVDYLNMADVFVLPTLNEGCCNAIIEAMACGLPIISSNRPFNKDVLDESNSCLVEPMNVLEIANAIKRIKEDVCYRQQLSDGAIKTASKLTISKRASFILDFIESKL